jgi:hypothetical protein
MSNINNIVGKQMKIKQYLLYLVRWQLSTPILAVVLIVMNTYGIGPTVATIIANLIGGLIFYWVDKYIFRKKVLVPWWETKEDISCCKCGKEKIRGYRLVKSKNYCAENKKPKFLCEQCSIEKTNKLRKKGIKI